MKQYIYSEEGLKKDVPALDQVVLVEGAAHFINQEKPHEISKHIFDFITKFWHRRVSVLLVYAAHNFINDDTRTRETFLRFFLESLIGTE